MTSVAPLVAVLVSADGEWKAVRSIIPDTVVSHSPMGEWFILKDSPSNVPILFFHSGWGKIASAASTQYVIDRWQVSLLVNLGTCGGIAGQIEQGAIVLVKKTVVYDIFEEMGDAQEHLEHYTTEIDLSWLSPPYPIPVTKTTLYSADRDLQISDIPWLVSQLNAQVVDWESGAIAWVADRNDTPCLILRGVTDLVGEDGGEAYENMEYWLQGAEKVLKSLITSLPGWISAAQEILSGR
ncbi:MAG: 5'-methylthioadenosine/S-adenosylhomocysteine nucleosidase [Chloroflexota bacterium]